MSYYDTISDKDLEYLKTRDLVKYNKVLEYRRTCPKLLGPHDKPGVNLDIQARLEQGLVNVEMWYNRSPENKIKEVQVGICDVRAADDIRIEYDFERDGWVVRQQLFWKGPEDEMVEDVEHWYEVAFVQAWGQQRKMTKEQYQHWLDTDEMPLVPESPQ